MTVRKIISGGQTGADRAALEAHTVGDDRLHDAHLQRRPGASAVHSLLVLHRGEAEGGGLHQTVSVLVRLVKVGWAA